MNLIIQGGLFMIPLLLCSLIMVAVIMERMVVFYRLMQQPLESYQIPENIVKSLRKRLIILHTIITISPMLGLLGTVTGLMKCFNLLGDAVSIYEPQQISLGISEALITTAVGLIIAVVTTIFYNYFNSRLESYVEEYNYGL